MSEKQNLISEKELWWLRSFKFRWGAYVIITWLQGAPYRRRTVASPWRSCQTGRTAARPLPIPSSTPAAATPGRAPCHRLRWRAARPGCRLGGSGGRRSSSRTFKTVNRYVIYDFSRFNFHRHHFRTNISIGGFHQGTRYRYWYYNLWWWCW